MGTTMVMMPFAQKTRLFGFSLLCLLFFSFSVFGLMACGGGSDDAATTTGSNVPDGSVELTGAVQKGPLVLGSSVSVSTLNEDWQPTGQVYNT